LLYCVADITKDSSCGDT